MTIKETSAVTAADALAYFKIEANGGAAPPAYPEPLVTHWAEAVIDGPMKNIERYDDVAKLLVMVATPLQAALFALYDKIGVKLGETSPHFLAFLLFLFIASIVGVVGFVVKVCDKRPQLRICLSRDCSRSVCNHEVGLISYLLDPTIADPHHSTKLSHVIGEWERHIEDVVSCKHMWLTCAVCCFVGGSLIPIGVLFVLALSK
ncbi:MAG: hypothetical protein ABW208_16095 [Pyrinomonadaceae bacterium]